MRKLISRFIGWFEHLYFADPQDSTGLLLIAVMAVQLDQPIAAGYCIA
jgi:hypothetical protein